MDFSLNVTAMVLFVSSTFIIAGSSIWIFVSGIGPSNDVAVASCNLASLIGIGVGATLMQVDLCRKNRELRSLRVYSPNVNHVESSSHVPEL